MRSADPCASTVMVQCDMQMMRFKYKIHGFLGVVKWQEKGLIVLFNMNEKM
jgi:hypothetical protein